MQLHDPLYPDLMQNPTGEGFVTSEFMLVRQAQSEWATQPLRHRLRLLQQIRHTMVRNLAHLEQTVAHATHRIAVDTLAAEILPLADACRFLEREAPRLLRPQRSSTRGRPLWLYGVTMEIRREPFGVVLIIAPSNYPLLLPGVQTLQALAAGNAVLLKPGRDSRKVALAFVDLLRQAGMDPRLVRVLPESPAAAAEAIAHGVDKVILTGSADTGAAVLAELAPKLTPATLELSGCDAAFVCADADLDLVSAALQFSLRFNGGATCIAPRRVLVDRTLADALETRLVQAVSQLEPSLVGAKTSSRVQVLVAEACQQGARQLTGAVFPNNTMAPVVVADAIPKMRLLHEDILAPILAMVRVDGPEDALIRDNCCPYALGATVFGHRATASVFAQRINAGVVVVNDVMVPTADPRLPFGGRGRSGYGVTRGAEGLLALTIPKAIAVRRGRWRPHYAPSQPEDAALFAAYITAAHGGSWLLRVAALRRLLGALVKRGRKRPLPQVETPS